MTKSEGLTKQRTIAWVRLLANSKKEPITIEYCGKNKNGLWLWQIKQGKKYITLQGTEFQNLETLQHI